MRYCYCGSYALPTREAVQDAVVAKHSVTACPPIAREVTSSRVDGLTSGPVVRLGPPGWMDINDPYFATVAMSNQYAGDFTDNRFEPSVIPKESVPNDRERIWRESYQAVSAELSRWRKSEPLEFDEDFAKFCDSIRVFDGSKGKAWEP